MKMFWFIFQDGYRECTYGYSRSEMKHMEGKHGPLVQKIPA